MDDCFTFLLAIAAGAMSLAIIWVFIVNFYLWIIGGAAVVGLVYVLAKKQKAGQRAQGARGLAEQEVSEGVSIGPSGESLPIYLQIIRRGGATTNQQMVANFLSELPNEAPYRNEDGVGSWPLLFYGYSPLSPDGEVRSTLFIECGGKIAHSLTTAGNGRFTERTGMEDDPDVTRVGISLFAKHLVRYTGEGFQVAHNERVEDLDLVLARSLWFIHTVSLPPVFGLSDPLKI
ncbi:hypothetical protein ABZ769_11045 [Streptomyces olivoreticuli]